MFYQIRNTRINRMRLMVTASSCYTSADGLRVRKAAEVASGDFVVCSDCILYPNDQIGLKNVTINEAQECERGTCIICNETN